MTVELTEETLLKKMPPIRIPFINGEASGEPGTVTWGNIIGKPSTFTPSPHTHNQGEIAGLQETINNLQDEIDEVENIPSNYFVNVINNALA